MVCTGLALRIPPLCFVSPTMPAPDPKAPAIRIFGARQNNLRNLSLDLALNRLTVVTGVSGSG